MKEKQRYELVFLKTANVRIMFTQTLHRQLAIFQLMRKQFFLVKSTFVCMDYNIILEKYKRSNLFVPYKVTNLPFYI